MKRNILGAARHGASPASGVLACSVVTAGLAMLAAGCSKNVSEPAHRATPPAAEAPSAVEPAQIHGTRKLANIDIPVYVDGKEAAVLRYGELPGGMTLRPNPIDESHESRFYRLDEYLKAIGVPLGRVRAVQLSGNGEHVASVEGSELRKDGGRFVFHFLGTDTGIANLDWETTSLKNTHRINEIRGVSVFVAKDVPRIDSALHCRLDAAGSCDATPPYSDGEIAKGTRIYVDGKMIGFVKRRLVDDAILVGKREAGDPRYSLSGFVASLGGAVGDAKRVDLIAGDSVIARIDGATWSSPTSPISFTLAKHSHGKVVALVPEGLQAKGEGVKDRDAQITAVQVYRSVDPPSRPLVAIDDVLEAAGGGDGQQAALGSGDERRDRARD